MYVLSAPFLSCPVLQRGTKLLMNNNTTDEDYCQQCTDDFNNGGRRHIDIWTGSSTVNGGNEQVDCENKLTPNGDVVIVRSPAGNYEVDSAPLYHKVCLLYH